MINFCEVKVKVVQGHLAFTVNPHIRPLIIISVLSVCTSCDGVFSEVSLLIKSHVNLYSGVSDRSHFKAAVQRQPQVRTMLEWRWLAANRKVRRMAASIPNTAPVVHFTPSRSRYQFIQLGEQRHTCVNNLPRVAPSGGTAENRTRRCY